MQFRVNLSARADQDIKKVPSYIKLKLLTWVEDVLHRGLHEVRKIKGYHDEPLKGIRSGQRSIRLSKSYRAIYEINNEKQIEMITVLEVNKHEY